jgi:hypothetical protein
VKFTVIEGSSENAEGFTTRVGPKKYGICVPDIESGQKAKPRIHNSTKIL